MPLPNSVLAISAVACLAAVAYRGPFTWTLTPSLLAALGTGLSLAVLLYHRKKNHSTHADAIVNSDGVLFLRAALDGDVPTCKHMLTTAAAPLDLLRKKTSETSWTALHVAAGNGRTEILRTIIEFLQANHSKEIVSILEGRDEGGNTPLLLAVSYGQAATAGVLIENGADVMALGPRGRNVIHLAALSNLPGVVAALRACLPKSVFQSLAQAGDRSGYNALHFCGLVGATDIANMLLEARAVDIDAPALDGTTALHAACRLGKVDMVNLLLNYHAAMVACRFGNTPLHVACAFARPEVVRVLLQRIARDQLSAQDNDGLAPLQTACQALAMAAKAEGTKTEGTKTEGGTGPGDTTERDEKVAQVLECIRLLVAGGSPLDAVDYGGCSAVYLLSWGAGAPQLEAIKYIFDHLVHSGREREVGALLHQQADSGWCCLQVAHNIKGPAAADVLAFLQSLAEKYCPELLKIDLAAPRDTSNTRYHQRKGEHNRIPIEQRRALLQDQFSVAGLAGYLQRLQASGTTPRVLVVCGAGISTSAGIKDFRSSNGLYADKSLSSVFSAKYLYDSPQEFYDVVRTEFVPHLPFLNGSTTKPTTAHALLRLLRDHGWLTRVYTQNVDALELAAGLTEDDVVECHGSFRRAYCTGPDCGRTLTHEEMAPYWASVAQGNVPCCCACGSVLRPDVVLFGEPLPARFHDLLAADVTKCNFLLVMGTSLVVYPVAALPAQVGPLCVRALFNREATGCFQYVPPCPVDGQQSEEGSENSDDINAMRQEQQSLSGHYRDVFIQGGCDAASKALIDALGWSAEL